MPTVADVVRRHGSAYLARFGDAVPHRHRKVLRAIAACRTGELGTVVFACSTCGHRHHIGRSCGDRHCPTCQQDRTRAWLAKESARLLPCPYFLLTFTLPAELRRFVRAHQEVCYAALFEASSSAIRRLAADARFVGTESPGFFGVLHTWGRTLEYHPHVHYVVPGGGPSPDGSRWLPSRAHFFVPVKALSKIYRAIFREAMERAGLAEQVDPAVWRRDWVVHSQAAGDGRGSLRYLSAYVFRVAIGDHRIRSCEDGQVTFTYRRSGSRRPRSMTLGAHEFLRRFLQHVLPCGFQKVRYYGFASPNARPSLEAVRWLAALHAGERFVLGVERTTAAARAPSEIYCGECGGRMCVVAFVRCRTRVVFDTS
jgi:hypothetical protein